MLQSYNKTPECASRLITFSKLRCISFSCINALTPSFYAFINLQLIVCYYLKSHMEILF